MLAAGVADECAFRAHPVLRTDRRSRPGSSRRRASAATSPRRSACPGPLYRRFDELDADGALAWWREFGRPVVVKLDGLAAGKGVIVPADDDRDRSRDPRHRRARPVRARGAAQRAGVLAARAVRRRHRRCRCRSPRTTSGSARATPDPNTGGMGAYAPAPVAHDAADLVRHVRASRSSTTSPSTGHAVRRGAVRRADADARRATAGRVQLPVRRPRDAGRAAAARRPTSPSSRWRARAASSASIPIEVRDGRGVHGRRRRPRLPRHAGARRADQADRLRRPPSGRTRRRPSPTRSCSRPACARAAPPAGACSPSPGSAPISRRRAPPPTAGWTACRSRTCRCAATSAGEPRARCSTSYAATGVDIDEGNRAVAKMKRCRRAHARARRAARRRQLRRRDLRQAAAADGRPGAGRLDRRRRHQGRARGPARDGARASGTTSSTTASTTCSCSRRGRCSSSTTSPPACSTPTSSPRSSAAWPRRARPPAARCSAARRPRCRACTCRARSTSPARWSASPSARSCCPATTSPPATC